jgi:manganese transport system ATP-binding protein
MTTHDLGDAAQADHVILLAGRVVAEGPPADVLTAERLSEAYAHRIISMEGRPMVDDPAHQPTDRRHVHLDRSKGGVTRT